MADHDADRFGASLASAELAPTEFAPERPDVLHIRQNEGITTEVLLRVIFLASDLLAAVIAFGTAFLLAKGLHVAFERPYYSFSDFIEGRDSVLAVMLVLMVAVFSFGGLYSRNFWDAEEIKRIFLASGLLGLFHAAFQVLTHDYTMRLWFLIVWPLLACVSVVLRVALRSLPPMRRALTRNVLMVGKGMDPRQFAFQLREAQSDSVRILDSLPIAAFAPLSSRALGEFLVDLAARTNLPAGRIALVLVPDDAERALVAGLSERLWLAGVTFSTVMPEGIPARRRLRLHKIIGLDSMLAEVDPPFLSRSERILKRGGDILIAGFALVLLAPAMLVIALVLAREGDVFFQQLRVGLGGRRFQCLKFRSMRPDAEARLRTLLQSDPAAQAEWNAFQKLAHDPRITPFGRFLRASSLDELPQLLNVLRGDMSLVGPRPIIAPEVPGYPGDHAYFACPDFTWYATCRPGITGLWQVSGRATNRYDERIRLDRWYVRNWSVWLDIAILVKTIRVLLVSRNAS